MQYRAKLPVSQQSNVVPVEIMRDEALWHLPYGVKGAEYRDVPSSHRVHRHDFSLPADSSSHSLISLSIETVTATGVY